MKALVAPPLLHGSRSPGSRCYPYKEELLALDCCVGQHTVSTALLGVTTPLNVDGWASMLARHPDHRYAGYIISGLHEGFRIGTDRSRPTRSATRNMPSAPQHQRVVT